MKKNNENWKITYYVDIPQCINGIPSDEWRTVEYFRTEKEAIKFAQEYFGANEQGKVSLISQS